LGTYTSFHLELPFLSLIIQRAEMPMPAFRATQWIINKKGTFHENRHIPTGSQRDDYGE
jgi:hypothetical protein